MEVTIKAGEMLFIPAGWFHEVRSTGGGKVGHLALNYWFHPPDGSTFEKPYTSDFWVNDWKRRNLE
jgi:quercetin dioxygenase-like cupin family protein